MVGNRLSGGMQQRGGGGWWPTLKEGVGKTNEAGGVFSDFYCLADSIIEKDQAQQIVFLYIFLVKHVTLKGIRRLSQ